MSLNKMRRFPEQPLITTVIQASRQQWAVYVDRTPRRGEFSRFWIDTGIALGLLEDRGSSSRIMCGSSGDP